MKNLIVLTLVSLASVNALAAPKSARITSMDLDPQAFPSEVYTSGYINLDTRSRIANLFIYRKATCKPGKVCPMGSPSRTIELKITSRKTNQCNAVVYTAMEDKRIVDGIQQILTITENKNYSCQPRVPAVSITYETNGRYMDTGNTFHTFSTFMAERFVSAQE